MTRRRQHVPWKAAGTASESEHSADDVVRETGWVFNNVTGSQLNLAEFVDTADTEIGASYRNYLADGKISTVGDIKIVHTDTIEYKIVIEAFEPPGGGDNIVTFIDDGQTVGGS